MCSYTSYSPFSLPLLCRRWLNFFSFSSFYSEYCISFLYSFFNCTVFNYVCRSKNISISFLCVRWLVGSEFVSNVFFFLSFCLFSFSGIVYYYYVFFLVIISLKKIPSGSETNNHTNSSQTHTSSSIKAKREIVKKWAKAFDGNIFFSLLYLSLSIHCCCYCSSSSKWS